MITLVLLYNSTVNSNTNNYAVWPIKFGVKNIFKEFLFKGHVFSTHFLLSSFKKQMVFWMSNIKPSINPSCLWGPSLSPFLCLSLLRQQDMFYLRSNPLLSAEGKPAGCLFFACFPSSLLSVSFISIGPSLSAHHSFYQPDGSSRDVSHHS